MNNKLIELHDIYKTYSIGEQTVKALDGINLKIDYGEYLAILGPSGSGKSTLMNLLGCLDQPTSGEYILAGENVSRLPRKQLSRIRNYKIGFK